jgi:uncharacterized protein
MLSSANGFSMAGRDVLFASWPIPVRELRPHVPEALEIDTYDGSAWISALAIYIQDVRPELLDIDTGIEFPQLNFRTYVTFKDQPGVYFLTLDTGDGLGASLGRPTLGLPFYRASIEMGTDDSGVIEFRSRRAESGVARGSFEARYKPTGKQFHAEEGTLDEFLVERHKYFVAGEKNRRSILPNISSRGENASKVQVGEIERDAWTLSAVDATIQKNTLFRAIGLDDPESEPHVRYSPLFTTTSNPLKTVGTV